MKTISLAVLILALANASHGFYYTKNEASQNLNVLNDFEILVNESEFKEFPSSFQVNFNGGLDGDFKNDFVKIDSADNRDVYVIDPATGLPTKYEPKSAQAFEHYQSKNGQAIATLIRNEENAKNPFRMIGTIISDTEANVAYDIVPVNMENSSKRDVSDSYDSHSNQHAIRKRNIDNKSDQYASANNAYVDYVMDESFQSQILNQMQEKSQNSKRALNGKPVTLNCELLIVTDNTVLDLHKLQINQKLNDLAFAHMRTYYAHLVKLINQRYQDTLATDADLKINVVLKGFLFLTDAANCAFLDPVTNGVPGISTYKNRGVVQASKALNAFMAYMNNIAATLPPFDHAAALFNKDIFSDTGSTADGRSMVVGFAPVSGVCTNRRYSLNEDVLGFSNAGVIAHELGHNLGASHDGDGNTCSPENNFLMSPSPSKENLLNQLKFSSCSINFFKRTLLNATAANGISTMAQCLANAPTNTPVENTYVANLPGASWTPNDQCQMRQRTQNASFCQNMKKDICSEIWCRNHNNPSSCSTTFDGAIDGTPCAAGKICFKGVCTANAAAPAQCPFGDEGVFQIPGVALPKPFLTCQEGFALMTQRQISVNGYCSHAQLGPTCCLSCRKWNAMTCKDTDFNCPQYTTYCNGGTLNGVPVSKVCPRTCKVCSATPLTCTPGICLNRGTCVNQAVDSNFGFVCKCQPGFSGEFCENRNACDPNPCLNGGSCLKFGSSGFVCRCPSKFSGQNCSRRV